MWSSLDLAVSGELTAKRIISPLKLFKNSTTLLTMSKMASKAHMSPGKTQIYKIGSLIQYAIESQIGQAEN